MSKIKIDFTGVESFISASEGEHIAKLISIEEGTTAGGDDKLTAKFEVTTGSCKGARVFETFTLTQTALWKFKGFLDAIQIKAEGKVIVNTETLVGKVCIIDVIVEEYDGKKKSKIQSYKKLAVKAQAEPDEDEVDDDFEEEEVAPPPPAKKEKPKVAAPPQKQSAPPPAKAPVKATKPVVPEESFDDDDDDDWGDDD